MPTLEQLQAEISDLREKMQRLDAETDKWVGRMMASPWTWLIALGLFALWFGAGVGVGHSACGA